MTMNVNMESPCAGRTIVDKLISEATPFVAACYGSKVEGSGSLKWQTQRPHLLRN